MNNLTLQYVAQIAYFFAFSSPAHFAHGGVELSDEVRGRGLVPVITLDSDTADWISATQEPRLHRKRWPVWVQSVEDVLWGSGCVGQRGWFGVDRERDLFMCNTPDMDCLEIYSRTP